MRIVDDSSGRLHATWQTFQEAGYGQGVYYARSLDGGQTWSEPKRFRFREAGDGFVSWPYLISRGDDELHLNYVNGSNVGRAYRFSMDGGETWSEAEDILLEMQGINGYVVPILDGNNRMHMIVNMRTYAGQDVGIYYSRQLPQGGWSFATPIDDFSPAAPSAHYAAAATRLGNEIHTVYNQISDGEIWYVRGDIQDVEPSAERPLPQLEPAKEIDVEQTENIAGSERQAVTPVHEFSKEPPTDNPSPFSSLLVAGVAALLFVIFVVLIKALRR